MKLYVYPNAAPHAHDLEEGFENTVPLSREGLKQVDLVGPEEAEYFYMGQIGDQHANMNLEEFQYFAEKNTRHIVDVEGDWLGKELPALDGAIFTINGCLKEYLERFRCFVRPTFSTRFLSLIKDYRTFSLPNYKSFGFLGQLDPFGLRYRLRDTLLKSRLPHDYRLCDKWYGKIKKDDPIYNEFEESMLKHIFCLCPRGAGHDTVRFYEACFYGRVPIIIGDNVPFCAEKAAYFQISQYDNPEKMIYQLKQFYETPISKLGEMGQQNMEYFEEIRRYMADPTKYFLDWLNVH